MIEEISWNIDLSWAPLAHRYVEGNVGDLSHPHRVVDMSLVLGDRLKISGCVTVSKYVMLKSMIFSLAL